MKIIEGSKLQYNILSEPSKNPAAVQTCPERNESMRVVADGEKKKIVPWPLDLEAAALLSKGEESYRAGKYDEAAVQYKAALAKDPQLAAAYLFYGDTLLFGANDYTGALIQYLKAIALDPTLPKAHFFASSAYLKLGRTADAREEVIRALTYAPSYPSIWKIALNNPQAWGAKPVIRHEFHPPDGFLGARNAKGVDVFGGPKGEWLGYAICKAVWANEPQFQARHGKGGWSLEEEHACLYNQVMSAESATKGKLTGLEAHLDEVANAGLLDGYILFEIAGRHCPLMLSVMNDEARKQVEDYIRRYVIVAAKP